jgi:NAD+ synthase (glutamine-hydrolysing)
MNIKIAVCQINPTVGEISYNTNLICQNIISCVQKNEDKNGSVSGSENKSKKPELLIIFPELAISGYPPEDLLYHPQWPNKIKQSLNKIQELAQKYNVHILIGHPDWLDNICINAASLISPENHQIIAIKNLLPNTGVFDERRYFTSQKDLELKSQENPNFFEKSNLSSLPNDTFELNFESNKIKFGVLICEDGWKQDKAIELKSKGAEALIQINASPFEINKANIRHQKALEIFKKTSLPLISVQLAGAQDELVFDGGSFVIKQNANCTGKIKLLSPYFKEHISLFDLSDLSDLYKPIKSTDIKEHIFATYFAIKNKFKQSEKIVAQIDFLILLLFMFYKSSKSNSQQLSNSEKYNFKPLEPMEQIYLAIISSCKDYFQKNNFDGALIGLSGGIDSALTLALAVDALGPNKVEVILMPSKYTSNLSLNCARAQLNLLKMKPENIKNINIDNIIATFTDSLKGSLDLGGSDKSCEANKYNSRNKELCLQNLQARARGMLLMAQSNLSGKLVLTTGNKSELAMGYSTLYGDMCGAYNLLKDLYKTQVYDLSRWINSKKMVIPNAIISRAPTAELAHDQKDEDSLPAYNLLDPILIDIIENNKSKEQLVNQGFDPIILEQVFKAIKNSEYKRQQSPPGVKINKRAFGRDWRYPIKM